MYKLFQIIYLYFPPNLKKLWDKIERSDIGNRIVLGTFWSLFGSVISQGLILLSSILVARILGKNTYGELGIIRSTINMFSVFAGFGLGVTATKYIAEYKIKDKDKVGKIIGLSIIFSCLSGLIISSLIFCLAPFLAKNTINAPNLVNQLYLGTIILFFSSLNGTFTGILAGYEAFKKIAKINILASLISFPIQIFFTSYFGLSGSVLGLGSNFLILGILNYRNVLIESQKFGINIQYKNVRQEQSILYRFSLPAFLSGLLVSPVIWVCNAMLVNKPGGYGEMAIFEAANQWRSIILFIPSILGLVILPLISSSNDNILQFKRIVKINILINFLVSILIAILFSLFATLIMNSYGKGFEEGSLVIIILSFTSVLIAINNVIGQAIVGTGKMWIGFFLNLNWGITLIIFNYLFQFLNKGAIGLSMAYLASYLIHSLVQFLILKTILKKKND